MAEISAFNGIRYGNRIKDLSQVVTQPYDKITKEMQENYYNKSEYNIVRIILGKTSPSDNDNQYNRARDYFERWQNDGIFIQDSKPSIYPYYQEYRWDGRQLLRRGFICLIKLEDFSIGTVLPHERTMSGPKEDRLQLLRATKANFGQIFMLYPDPQNAVASLIESNISDKEPIINTYESYENNVRHKVWRIDEEEVIEEVKERMRDKTLLIADGHHRYETALKYRNENSNARYRMATLVSMDDPGLVILPTYRALHSVGNLDDFSSKVSEFFEIEQMSSKEMLFKVMKGRKHCFGLYFGGKFCILTLKDEDLIDRFVGKNRSPEYKLLDVTVLHAILIEHILGISKEEQASKQKINYLRDANLGIEGVDRGKYDLVFFMNPTRIDEVKRISEKKELMPQKSTDFYPKLITGLIINHL
jgi:uncharacterized protein (DUF1015 family)